MVARRNGFAHGGNAIGVQTCQQDRRLHLRARNGRRVVNGVQISAANFQGRAVAIEGCNICAHLPNGSTMRRIGRLRRELSPVMVEANDCPASTPERTSNRRAGIFRIQGAARRLQAIEANASDAHAIFRNFDLNAQAAQAFERAATVGGRGVIEDFTRSFSERGENRVAM